MIQNLVGEHPGHRVKGNIYPLSNISLSEFFVHTRSHQLILHLDVDAESEFIMQLRP